MRNIFKMLDSFCILSGSLLIIWIFFHDFPLNSKGEEKKEESEAKTIRDLIFVAIDALVGVKPKCFMK